MSVVRMVLSISVTGMLFTGPAMADFGKKKALVEGLSLEMRGVPENLASLILYADAVAIVKRESSANCGSIVTNLETVWQRDGGKPNSKFYVACDERIYQNNQRSIDEFSEFSYSHFAFPLVNIYANVPTLVFLREAVISEDLRGEWALGSLPVYKVVNGGEGSVPLPHLAGSFEIGGGDRLWEIAGKHHLKRTSKIIGSDNSHEIVNTIRSFYKGERREFELLNNQVSNKLRKDAALMMMKMIKEGL